MSAAIESSPLWRMEQAAMNTGVWFRSQILTAQSEILGRIATHRDSLEDIAVIAEILRGSMRQFDTSQASMARNITANMRIIWRAGMDQPLWEFRSFLDREEAVNEALSLSEALDPALRVVQHQLEVELADAPPEGLTQGMIERYYADTITNLMAAQRVQITRELRQAAVGARTYQDLVTLIGQNLTDASVFTSIAKRAEMIIRTEVGRVWNAGYWRSAELMADRIENIRKMWVHSVGEHYITPEFGEPGYRPRVLHVALDGTTRPVHDPFNVGGWGAMGPHDPALPPGETIGCMCRLAMDFSEVRVRQA